MLARVENFLSAHPASPVYVGTADITEDTNAVQSSRAGTMAGGLSTQQANWKLHPSLQVHTRDGGQAVRTSPRLACTIAGHCGLNV